MLSTPSLILFITFTAVAYLNPSCAVFICSDAMKTLQTPIMRNLTPAFLRHRDRRAATKRFGGILGDADRLLDVEGGHKEALNAVGSEFIFM